MKYKYLFLSLFFATAALAAEVKQAEIRIYLSTTSSLEPLYIGKLSSDNSLSPDYLSQLESILNFDFSYNGTTRVLPISEIRENVLAQATPAQRYHSATWKNGGVLHVIKGEIQNKSLSISVFSSQTSSLKQFPAISLSGVLGKDRVQLHRLADAIYQTLYGKAGVANTRILYAVKQKSHDKWISEIWSCDWDGGNPKQLTREGSYSITPIFIPSSSKYANDKFLYVSYKMGQPKIFIASFQEGIGKRLIDLRGNQLLPAISPHRDKIAFI